MLPDFQFFDINEMSKFILIWMIVIGSLTTSFGQSSHYVHHTEIGTLLGRTTEGYQRINFTFLSFHGVNINSANAIGLLVGMDTYPEFTLLPIAVGWRGILDGHRKVSSFASVDLGYAIPYSAKRTTEGLMESWYYGGTYIGPAIGIRKKSKNPNLAYSWTFGFKRQFAKFLEGQRMIGHSSLPINNRIPPGFSSIVEKDYIFNSLQLKWGIIF